MIVSAVFYVVVGAIVGVCSVDKHGNPAPLLHFFAIVLLWPVVIIQTVIGGRG